MKSQAKFIHFHSRKIIWKYRLRNVSNVFSVSICLMISENSLPATEPHWGVFMFTVTVDKWSTVKSSDTHDDVIKWKHFPRYWPFVRGIHRSPVNSPHKGQWRGAFMFSLICALINDWVKNGDAGDLRRHRVHFDVIVKLNDVWE